MKLHIKLSIAMLSCLIVIIAVAQIIQYFGAVKLISTFAEDNMSILKEREEQAVRNIFRSVGRAVSGSLERGEMEKFVKLLEAQKNVEGLLEFSLYDQEGIVTHSSDPSFLDKPLSEDLRDPLLGSVEQRLRHIDNVMEIYQPQIVMRDCIRCHKTWELGSICGVMSMRFSTQALANAELRAAETIQDTERTFLTNSLATLIGIIVVFMIMMFMLVTKYIDAPLNSLVQAARQIARGNIKMIQLPNASSRDEIGILTDAFTTMSSYLQRMAEVATKVSTGELHHNIRAQSAKDLLGQAFLNMSAYLNEMGMTATAIAEGDLTRTIHVRSADDTFGQAIQTMTEGLRTLIVQIRSSAEQIAATKTTIVSLATRDIDLVRNVNDSMKHVVSTANEMGASVEEIAQNMEALSSSMEETSTSVSQMTSTVAHIASNATALHQQAQQTGKALDETVTSLENVVKNTDVSQQLAQGTIQDALEGQQAVEQVTNSMETIQQTVTTSVEAITRFEQRSRDIDTVLKVIRDITDQTSLLALNASIIAAQAGEHGRGFTIIADEIKTLANGVNTSTKDIAVIVNMLQKETAQVVQTIHTGAENVQQGIVHTREAGDTLQKILSSTQRSSSVVTEITEALHTLMATSRNVSLAMEQVNTMAGQITQATREHHVSTNQIQQTIRQINEMSTQIQHATAQQSVGVRQVLEAADNVAVLTDQDLKSSQEIAQTSEILASQADMLLREVDRFKLSKHP